MLKGPVIGFFRPGGKSAGGKLPGPKVIGNTVTADTLAGTGFIAAIAALKILFFFTFHVIFNS